jgi:glutamate/tyrosine decarboxylase-like PLP-dependent enzyme
MDEPNAALARAHEHAREWLDSLTDRAVPAQASVSEIAGRLGRDLPEDPTPAAEVVDLLALSCTPGLVAMPSGRFFGFVVGGTHPAALGADWLTAAWDQNAFLRQVTPAHSAVEDITRAWLLDLLGLPVDAAVGFVTGATMSNFTCLAAARDSVLRTAGWDLHERGLSGGPGVRVVAGRERHETVDQALRYLGLGVPEIADADDQGRLDVASLAGILDERRGAPTIVVLQAGNVHSGAFDPFAEAIRVAHEAGAWVHVDGAFGLFAATSPTTRRLTAGYDAADSWTTDAHKTLNVPYDCGIAIVRERRHLRAAMSMHGDYLVSDPEDQAADPFESVPESSRRGRAFTVWAVLRALGRRGTADLIDGFCRHAQALRDGISAIDGAEILNDVEFTQVCVSFGSDERTQAVVRAVLEDGTTWMSGSRWHDRAVMRIAVSNASTTDEDVRRSVDAVRRAVASVA